MMSTTDLYILNGKSTRHIAEFRNGWGSGPVVWNALSEKYIPEKPPYTLHPDHMRKVFALLGNCRLERYERIVLQMTADKSYVAIKDLRLAGNACLAFWSENITPGHANHWSAIAATLLRYSDEKFNRHARGICMSCTSVQDDWSWPDRDQLEGAWPVDVSRMDQTNEQ